MAQNIYDNPEFFSGYTQYPRQVIGLDGATEWPTVRAMLPPIQGKRVADLGCGFRVVPSVGLDYTYLRQGGWPEDARRVRLSLAGVDRVEGQGLQER